MAVAFVAHVDFLFWEDADISVQYDEEESQEILKFILSIFRTFLKKSFQLLPKPFFFIF